MDILENDVQYIRVKWSHGAWFDCVADFCTIRGVIIKFVDCLYKIKTP